MQENHKKATRALLTIAEQTDGSPMRNTKGNPLGDCDMNVPIISP